MYCITERSALFNLVIGLSTIGVGEGKQEGNRPLTRLEAIRANLKKYSCKPESE